MGVTLEQDSPEFILKRLNLLGKSALADIQTARGLGEIQGLRRSDEILQLSEFHGESLYYDTKIRIKQYICSKYFKNGTQHNLVGKYRLDK